MLVDLFKLEKPGHLIRSGCLCDICDIVDVARTGD